MPSAIGRCKGTDEKRDSRVEGTLDVVGSLLNVGLLGVGLNSSSDLVGEVLSAL